MRLIAILMLVATCGAHAATWVGITGSWSETDSNLNQRAVSGDTVLMPAKTNHWTQTLTNNPAQPNVFLMGAGPIVGCTNKMDDPYLRPTNYVNSTFTVIIDDSANTAPIISFNFVTNLTKNGLSGFTIFHGTNSISDSTKPEVLVTGTSLLTRIWNVQWWNVGRTDLEWDGWVAGSFDHNVLWQSGNYTGVELNNDKYGGAINGNGAWSDTNNYFGTTNFPYIESNSGTNPRSAQGLVDGSSGNGGAMFVVRYNAMTNWNLGWHGSESSQYHRGTRRFEVYGNTMMYDTNNNTTYFTGMIIRSGVGCVWSNWMYGYDAIGTVYAYRSTPGGYPPWGGCDGTNAWDLTASNILFTGTATSSSSSQLIDSTASWPALTGGYMIKNTDTGQHAEILANTATTANYNNNTPVSGSLSFVVGQHYQIAGLVTAQLDQPGRGGGDVITNDNASNPFNSTKGGIIAWPSEPLQPIYEWSNTYIHAPLGDPNRPWITSGSSTLITNRDFIDKVSMPGYTPLVFPNPLVAVTDPFISGQPQSQTVTVGATATFTVTASGQSTLHYQWTFNGSNVGTDSATYSRVNCLIGDNGGLVACVVTDTAGSASSVNATLTVDPDPTITVQPQNQSVAVGATANFSITAIGTTTLHYQWKFNGGNVGTDSSTYARVNCQSADNGGLVSCVVSDTAGNVTSSNATLLVTGGGGGGGPGSGVTKQLQGTVGKGNH